MRELRLLGGIALIALAIGINCRDASVPYNRLVGWAVTAASMIAFIALVGDSINQRPAGVLIDSRNRISLSKLQAASWTVLVLSGLVTLFAAKMQAVAGVKTPIAIDGNLLAAMGISAASLAATPAILSLKTTPAGASKVFARAIPQQATWADMFRGDETSNADSPDLSKIQNFLISLVVIGGYAFLFGNALYYGTLLTTPHGLEPAPGGGATGWIQFPELGQDLLWLLGISHAGYLSYKAVPHGNDTSPGSDPSSTPAG